MECVDLYLRKARRHRQAFHKMCLPSQEDAGLGSENKTKNYIQEF
jgi:hypothetical protein